MRRFLLWVLALLIAALLAGGWYAHTAWQEWKRSSNIQALKGQGVDVSLAGVQLAQFSVTQMREGRLFRAEGESLSLVWHWRWEGLMPGIVLDSVRVGRLVVDIPAWPGSGGQEGAETALPRQLPSWLPDSIGVDQLVLTLPDGIRAKGDLTVSGLSSPDARQLVTQEMTLEAPIPELSRAGWRLHDGRARLVAAVTANAQAAVLKFSDESRLEFARVDAPDKMAQLDRLTVRLAGTTLTAGYGLQPLAVQSLTFTGPVTASTAAILHPQLHPQPWRLDGQIDSSLEGLRFDGKLAPDAGNEASIGLRFPFDGVPELDASLTAVGAEGARKLADTFTAWPEALEISEGSLKTSLALRFPPDGMQLHGEMNSKGLSGLFDRTAWAGLNGSATLDLTDNRLAIQTSGLTLDTVNPGVALNTIQVAGRYRSTTERIAAGTLTLERASAKLLGGNLRIEPAEWRLSQTPLRVPLELSGIELSQLMRVYPAEGLAGSGVLRGTVPLQVGQQGVLVDGGRVEALAPGGTLKLPADRLSGMAQGNEAMELVVRAMQDFRYSVLNSRVDYDQDGKLTLGLRLEGSSPDVRDGHPIILNINLEEDIPALLTSLQLAGRVNEAVTEKVRNLMQERQPKRQSSGSGNESVTTNQE